MRYPKTLILITFVAITAGCGGGGGGAPAASSPPTPPPPPPANTAPTATFTVSTTLGFAPLTVFFDGGGSTDSDGTITTYAWDFGDGVQDTGPSTSHVYDEPGSYTVTLRVTDDGGFSDSSNRGLSVRGATLSGEVQILASSAVDSDVNDRLTTPISNNSFAEAQPIANPVQVGGFVNVPGAGEPLGNLTPTGDPADVFAVNLNGNELILLTIAETNADMDLELCNAQAQCTQASINPGNSESIQVTEPGAYFVRVLPAAGASNYVLKIGQNLSTAGLTHRRVSDDFVPGDVLLLRSEDPAALDARYAMTRKHTAGDITLHALAEAPSGAAARRAARARLAEELERAEQFGASETERLKYRTLVTLKHLARDPDVIAAEPNYRRYAHRTPDDPFYGLQWHYDAIRLPAAWDLTTGEPGAGGDDVIVAVVDTGVLVNHPDLQGQLVPGYDFVSDPARARDGDGIDPNPNDEGDLAFSGTSSFHGTHVAGTVAAASDNGAGVAGVAWGAKIMPLRALAVDGGTSFDVIQAVRFAAGLANDSNTLPQRRADIINLSLGSGFSSFIEESLYEQIRAAGILVIASAGNESSATPSFPAGYTSVISVSATDINSALAPYSNFGPSIDLAAPGGYNLTDQNGDGIGDGVVSTLGDDSSSAVQFGYAALNGTSMAAPHVAGVAALMKAVHPALTPAEFTAALMAGELTDDLGQAGRDDLYGYGQINAQKAVLEAFELASGSGVDPGPILGASTSSLNFGVLLSDASVTLSNLGTGNLVIENTVTSEPDWLTISPDSVDPVSGLGSYRLSVDRGGLADGSYSATATFVPVDAGTNSVTIDVLMQVSSLNLEADAGLHYVILVDDSGESVVPTAVLNVDNGVYAFELQDVPPGEFRLFGGSDMDDDSFLCDAGEACGSFRTLDAPETIVVNPSVTPEMLNMDFVSEFRAVLTTLGTAAAADAEAEAGTETDGIPFARPEAP